MVKVDKKQETNQLTGQNDKKIIRRLEQAIIGGQHWYRALLEAIGLWETTEEEVDGRSYHYLTGGEAFDWLLLAERLCQTVDSLIPEQEKTALLFHAHPPLNLPLKEFKDAIGATKYNQYLNYFYGITVEEALNTAVEEEVRKERRSYGLYRERDTANEAYRRIYGSTKGILLRRFRKARGYPQLNSISLERLKEFTYWLFKQRLLKSDKAKVASDTRKALNWLESRGYKQPAIPLDASPEETGFILPGPAKRPDL
ncbi:MAG: hypothetical protein V3S02_03005 [Dehalococcoidales bacterium]